MVCIMLRYAAVCLANLWAGWSRMIFGWFCRRLCRCSVRGPFYCGFTGESLSFYWGLTVCLLWHRCYFTGESRSVSVAVCLANLWVNWSRMIFGWFCRRVCCCSGRRRFYCGFTVRLLWSCCYFTGEWFSDDFVEGHAVVALEDYFTVSVNEFG